MNLGKSQDQGNTMHKGQDGRNNGLCETLVRARNPPLRIPRLHNWIFAKSDFQPGPMKNAKRTLLKEFVKRIEKRLNLNGQYELMRFLLLLFLLLLFVVVVVDDVYFCCCCC